MTRRSLFTWFGGLLAGIPILDRLAPSPEHEIARRLHRIDDELSAILHWAAASGSPDLVVVDLLRRTNEWTVWVDTLDADHRWTGQRPLFHMSRAESRPRFSISAYRGKEEQVL